MKILAVEDNEQILTFLKKGLQEATFAVDTADNGKDGLFLATTNSYDVIILDIMLPFLDGLSLCSQLRKMGMKTPIILLTAKDDSDDIVTGLDSGADDYVTKPFKLNELLARIRAVLRRKQNLIESLTFEDLSLDLARKSAKRANKSIPLTAKEFAILEFLLRHKSTVVTESMLIEHVWDMNYSNASNLVSVYIYRLRNKVDKGFERAYIHTLKNIGYILE